MADELWRRSACELVDLLADGELSARELIDVAEQRITQTNPVVNSIVTTCFEQAREQADAIASGRASAGLLHGLPVVVKDLDEVAGVRTTFGSPIYKEYVPTKSSAAVAALQRQGAIVVAKSNTPEFGAGANTFNAVFGETVSPWDNAKTCGGSSGGSATALATGQAWLATGTDLGGSLRIPAAFCSVVGLRPSPGRVPRWPLPVPFDVQHVVGPMARSVADLGLMLDAMCALDARDPLGFDSSAESFRQATQAASMPARVSWTPDLGGCAPVDPEVRSICAAMVKRMERGGVAVSSQCPDFSRASETFQTTRAFAMAVTHDEHYEKHLDMLKPDLQWNIEKGRSLTTDQLVQAELARAALVDEMAVFFETHDLLITPTVMVAPFDVKERYVTEVAGVTFDNYIDWVFHTFAITLTACPALSVPCGFTSAGLPVGLQLVGRPRGEAQLLSFAAAIEAAHDITARVPIDPIVRSA